MRTLAIVLTLAFSLACSRDRLFLDAGLLDGRTIGQLAATRDTTVLVVFDARTCLACGGRVARWLQVPRASSRQVLVLLTDSPDEREGYQFRLTRVPIAGILARASVLPQPFEALVVDSQVRLIQALRPEETTDRTLLLSIMDSTRGSHAN
jgi:hypothetical protein